MGPVHGGGFRSAELVGKALSGRCPFWRTGTCLASRAGFSQDLRIEITTEETVFALYANPNSAHIAGSSVEVSTTKSTVGIQPIFTMSDIL